MLYTHYMERFQAIVCYNSDYGLQLMKAPNSKYVIGRPNWLGPFLHEILPQCGVAWILDQPVELLRCYGRP